MFSGSQKHFLFILKVILLTYFYHQQRAPKCKSVTSSYMEVTFIVDSICLKLWFPRAAAMYYSERAMTVNDVTQKTTVSTAGNVVKLESRTVCRDGESVVQTFEKWMISTWRY